MPTDAPVIVGVISDTHGMLRTAAAHALADVSLIVHAGDIGDPNVLRQLSNIAPVHAVRGNCDWGPWADELPRKAAVEVGAAWLYVLHDICRLDLEPRVAGMAAVITGHTHRSSERWSDGVLYFNPGSAGARRSSAPATVGRLTVCHDALTAEVIPLDE